VTAHELLSTFGLYAGTFVVAAISSLLPFVAIDVFLVGVVVMAPGAGLPLVVLLAAAGQLAGKLPIYAASRGIAAVPGRHRERLERIRRWIARWEAAPHGMLLASAILGLPPFSILATAAGLLGVRTRAFCVIVFLGRGLRFAVIVAIASAAG
jgi:membrane protein YqaA with SNARE-associated domain